MTINSITVQVSEGTAIAVGTIENDPIEIDLGEVSTYWLENKCEDYLVQYLGIDFDFNIEYSNN